MPIHGISKVYRPQRSGKIHLGIKVKKTKKGGEVVEYPAEVDYFVLYDAPELGQHYGEKPKMLNITLPSSRFEKNFDEYIDKVFPQYLKRYTAAGLWCKGDGENATEVNPESEGGMEERGCPCEYLETGACRRIGIFRFRIQEIASFNVYQITTSSYHSIVNINSFIRDLIEHCALNRIDPSGVKLILLRKEETVGRLAKDGKLQKSKHHILMLDLDPRFYKNLSDVRGAAQLEVPGVPAAALPAADESLDPLFYPQAGEVIQGEPTPEDLAAAKERIDRDAAAKKEALDGGGGHWEPKKEKEEKQKEPEKEEKPKKEEKKEKPVKTEAIKSPESEDKKGGDMTDKAEKPKPADPEPEKKKEDPEPQGSPVNAVLSEEPPDLFPETHDYNSQI